MTDVIRPTLQFPYGFRAFKLWPLCCALACPRES